jgi:glutaredoxin-like protein NrdH
VKEFLSRAGAPFVVKEIDDDRAYDELIARGFRTVPVTIIGDRAIKGFDRDALESALADRADGR